MKVSVITILDNTNYGTYLQALATGMMIRKLGHDAEIIHYTRSSMTPKGRSKAILEDRGFLRWFHRCVLKSSKRTRELKDKDYEFLQSFLPVTKEYIGFEALRSNPPIADVYMTGSDQVWNSFYNRGIDRSFYLDFAPEDARRISYAASIGMVEIPENEVEETKSLLSKYQYITVRETAAKKLLEGLGIASEVVLDPTLLLNKDEWSRIAGKFPWHEDEPYLLTYSVEYGKENALIKHYAQAIAKKQGLKIYHITYSGMPSDNYYDKVFCYATPDEFLNLMLHASFIVVSSFHGTAFSVNFNKPFITVSPRKFNSRVKSLLDITGLESRLVTDVGVAIENFGEIEYTKVNSVLDKERIKSKEILSKMLTSESTSKV